jgi:ribosomal protein S18 acetylase RimI-like enzyme
MIENAMTTIRPARLQDARAIARIEVETWRTTYPGMLPDRVLLRMSAERQAGTWAGFVRHRPGDVLVAEQQQAASGRSDAVVGFGNCGPQRDAVLGYAGEVYTLYIAPEAQGCGSGRLLLLGLFARLVQSGHRSALIWVVRANPARFFYERLGGKLVLHRPIPLGGAPIEAVAYGWTDLPALIDRQARSGAGGSSPL